MLSLNPATPGLAKEIDRVLAENELVIREWSPIHLANLLRRWFWKDGVADAAAVDAWQMTCQYLYFPRLGNSQVVQTTIGAGAASRDFFGLAYGKEGDDYRGFSFYGVAELYPVKATLQFSKIVSELIELFSANAGTQVRIRVDIEANDARGFSENTVRAAKENSATLGVKSDFEP